jgi:hypothetical protein
MRQLYQFLVYWKGVGHDPTVKLSLANNPLSDVKYQPLKTITWTRVNADVFVYWWGEDVNDEHIINFFNAWLDAWRDDATQN